MALPVYEMVINPEEGSEVEVQMIALVDKPAIEKDFLAFNSNKLQFAVDNEKRIISGPAMVADTLIYRNDAQGEYNVFFSKQTIEQIAIKFAKKGYAKNINLFHDPSLTTDGVTVFNSFVSNKEIGIPPMAGFEDLPDGSWFISAKIEDEAIWNKVKNGELKGFSVEGVFAYSKKEKNIEEKMAEFLNGTFNQNGQLGETELMSVIQNLINTAKAAFNSPGAVPVAPQAQAAPVDPAVPATDFKLKDGTPVSISELAAGGVVMVGDVPAPAGEIELEDGTKVTVGEGGVITAVAGKQEPAPVDYSEQFTALNEKVTAYDQKFQDYESKFTQHIEAFNKMSESVNRANDTIVKLFAIVEQLAAQPTAEPAATSGNNFSTQRKEGKEERLSSLIENLKKLKTA
jgi:hypothetical protein